MSARTVVLLVAIVATGLIAGLFFGWLVSVIPGTRRIDDSSYIATMQSINRAIVNPGFVVPFLVSPILLIIAGVLEFRFGNQRRATFLWTAAAVYLIGVIGVTFVGNVPLNNSLDALQLGAAADKDLQAQRSAYEIGWNRWHGLRTAASVLSFVLAVVPAAVIEAD